MGLKVDVQFGQIAVSDLYLKISHVSGTKVSARYVVTFLDAKDGAEVPLIPGDDRVFTFGEPKGLDLPWFNVSANAWEQCYEDFKARFAKGLLPWVKGLREETGVVVARVAERVAPTPAPPEAPQEDIHLSEVDINPTSPEPEASVTTQAEEVKPTEGDINLPDPSVIAPEPMSIDDLVRSGTMLTEDEFAMRVGVLSGRIGQYAQQRIAARYDANARADMLRDIQAYIDHGALGLEITPAMLDSFTRANTMNTWITAQETHARQLIEQLPGLTLETLRAYSMEGAGWPND